MLVLCVVVFFFYDYKHVAEVAAGLEMKFGYLQWVEGK